MTTCTISMHPPAMPGENTRWDRAAVKRSRPVPMGAGHKPRHKPVHAAVRKAAERFGLTWTEHGREFRLQTWCEGPYPGTVWMAVHAPQAHFPGEMRLVDAYDDGRMSVRPEVYTAGGHKAHRSDGSPCYSSNASYQPGYAHNCAGCAADHEAGLVA